MGYAHVLLYKVMWNCFPKSVVLFYPFPHIVCITFHPYPFQHLILSDFLIFAIQVVINKYFIINVNIHRLFKQKIVIKWQSRKNWFSFIEQLFIEWLLGAYHYEKREYVKKNVKKSSLTEITIYIKLITVYIKNK